MTTFGDHHCLAFGGKNQFASGSADGVLHIWNCSTSAVQTFTPASHLSSTLTCVSWKHSSVKDDDKTPEVFEDRIISIGTVTGEILLFNSSTNELVSKMSGHKDQVNDICWHQDDVSTFYSCSEDNHIIEWNTNSKAFLYKWKAHKREIYSLSIGPYGRTLMSAGFVIKLWDLKTKSLLKKYDAHTSSIVDLSFISLSEEINKSETVESKNLINGSYFLSAGSEEKLIYVWQIRNKTANFNQIKWKKPISSLLLTSQIRSFDVFSSPSKKMLKLIAVTEDGEVNYFEETINGSRSLPSNPTKVIRVVDEEADVIKIVAARFDQDNKIQIVYGSELRYGFDHVDLSLHPDPEVCVIRQNPLKMKIVQETDNDKIRRPVTTGNVKSVVPGQTNHSVSMTKKRRVENNPEIMSMEEKLASISVEKKEDPQIKADSLAILLSQGLQSKDSGILNQVLQHGNLDLIEKTVAQLKIPSIIPLIEVLSERIQVGPDKALIFVKWLRSHLTYHAAFLMAHPDIGSILSDLFQFMTVRTSSHYQLSRLEGKLDCVMSQAISQTRREQDEPLYVYDEDSNDEDENLSDFDTQLTSQSEAESEDEEMEDED